MRVIAFFMSAVAVAVFAGWQLQKSLESQSEERVKTPTMITVRLAGIESAMRVYYDWRRRGPDAVANFSIENANEFEIASFEIVCHLFDKDAKQLGKLKHKVHFKLAANSKTSLNEVLFRNVESSSRSAICDVDNALPDVRR
jgi:hypothetical protein